MKGNELNLVLKYFLAWYEFHLEQSHIKEMEPDSAAPENHNLPVISSSQNSWRSADVTVKRMHQELQPVVQQDMIRNGLLAEVFQRWRDVTRERRHSPISRLTDPDIITNFVRRLQERVLGGRGVVIPHQSPPSNGSITRCSQPPQVASSQATPQQSPRRQQVSLLRPDIGHRAGGDTGGGRRPSASGPTPDAESRAASGRPLSPASVDLCAEIMTTHALQLAPRRPMPDSETVAELRRAPHLHSFLMNARSNRRQRPAAAAAAAALAPVPAIAAGPVPAPAAVVRPPYQDELERKAEQRRARQEECRRRRQEREATARQAERQRHQEFQQQLARERLEQQEQLRQRRLRQEQLRHRQLRGRQQLEQRQGLADGFRRHMLVRRVFRALVWHTQMRRQQESAAELWARSALLRRSLHRWRHHREMVAAEREEAARHWHRSRLAAWVLCRWKTYVHQRHLKAQAAVDLSQLLRLQAALRTWQASLALGRVRRRQKTQQAVLCDVRLTCAGALRRWRRLGDALEQERAIEARKERLRRIVREMVPDFQPPAAPPLPPGGGRPARGGADRTGRPPVQQLV